MDILGNLRSLIGEDLVLDPESVATRAAGIGRPDKMVAAAMARPKTTEQVSAILRWCNSNGVKVIPYGATVASSAAHCLVPTMSYCHSN